mgnify:FL=1
MVACSRLVSPFGQTQPWGGPARAPVQIEEHLRRHVGIFTHALATVLITVARAKVHGS